VIIERMSAELHLDQEYIRLVARTANYRYKIYEIPKRTGGSRTIEHPARELKLLQAWLAENLLSDLPIHTSAAAYRRGSSIKKHANVHRHNKFLLKVDFRNFFPSISGKDIVRVLKKD
jgi:RNA-directed DNA polymerase